MMTTSEQTRTEVLPSGLKRLGAAGPAPREGGRLVFRAAEKSVEFFDHLRAHYRETRRTAAEIPCDIRIVLADGTTYDTGTGIVRDVSPSGALIAGLKLAGGSFPAAAFKVALVLKSPEYNGIAIEASPVRFSHDPAGIGVKFDEISVHA
jgi:hypothetical protein